MKIEHPEQVGFAIGLLHARLNELRMIHIDNPNEIAAYFHRTKGLLDSMQPQVDFLAKQCFEAKTV